MTLDITIRATEVILSLAFIQQSLEHLRNSRGRGRVFAARIALSLAVLLGLWPALIGLVVVTAMLLHRYQGPYNGGADRMGALVLICVTAAHLAPNVEWSERAMGYLAVQLILSYFISGRVKIVNPDWRSGQALRDVFAFSAYPVAENLRALAQRARMMWVASWAVMGFELLFPVFFLSQAVLIPALIIAAGFHVANAVLFGLNRFVWVWIAAYPSILWLQARLF